MTKIGYCRVSTAEQNLDMQRNGLLNAGCEQIFQDIASGAKDDRVGLRAAMASLTPGSTLVVYKLDRLGRSLRHLIDTVTTLENRGVQFQSLQESLDTTSAGGRLVFHLFAALAEFERNVIRGRTKDGMKAAKLRGSRIGRPALLNEERLVRFTANPLLLKEKMSRATYFRYLRKVSMVREK